MTRLASGRATTAAKPDAICARDPILAGARGSNHPRQILAHSCKQTDMGHVVESILAEAASAEVLSLPEDK